MRDTTDLLALYDDLSPDEQAALRSALGDDADLADAARRWRGLRAAVRAELTEALPDRSLLVLHALADRGDLLSADERARLEASGVAVAVAEHPGLAATVGLIQADHDAFEAAWAEHTADLSPEAVPVASAETGASRRAPSRPAQAASREAVPSALRGPARQRPTRWVWRASALAAVALFAAVLTFLYGRDAGFERIVAEEARLVAFADGSEAKLAPGAVMMVPREGSDEDPRQARLLAGSALFDIERDPTQPFEVQTPNADVTVLGTTFGVDVEGEGTATHVVLASGRVRVAPREQADAAVELEPGQATRVAGLDAPEAPSPTDVATDLAWTGTVYARELSAAEVARRISAATGRPVTVDAGLAGESVSGTFHTDEGAQPALRTLALALDADLLRTPNDGFRLAR